MFESDAVSETDRRETSVTPIVTASAGLCLPYAAFATLRSQVSLAFPETLSVGLLKQADEQSLVGLLAVRKALDESSLRSEEIREWGLICSPRLMGRKRIAESFDKFRENGAWSVTPNIIPHSSLHSPSGLMSQALRLNGPNFGTGGMPGTEGEVLWAALPMLGRLPGVWIIWTGWDRESISHEGASCQALVLGLSLDTGQSGFPKLNFSPTNEACNPLFTFEALAEAFCRRADMCCSLDGATCSITFGTSNREATR